MHMNKKSWHRLILSLLGIALCWLTWHTAITELQKVRPETIASFTTLTVNTQYVIAAIIIFMVTGRLVYEWKMNTVSNIVEQGEQILAEDRTPAPKHFDDGSID